MQIPGALPNILKVWWVSASPLAFLFAGRILWEKTIWAWSQGPQMVGFALWLLIAIPYAIVRHRDIEPWDWLMMAGAVTVILAIAVPDTFFASVR